MGSAGAVYCHSRARRRRRMKLRTLIWLAILFAIADAAPARAQDVTEDWHLQATIALQNNNCELALSLTEAARRTEDPEADYRFGLFHEWGQCVPQNDARALAHFVAAGALRDRPARARRGGLAPGLRCRGRLAGNAPARPACPRHITRQPCCFLIPTVARTTQARGKHSWANSRQFGAPAPRRRGQGKYAVHDR